MSILRASNNDKVALLAGFLGINICVVRILLDKLAAWGYLITHEH
jgi:hypothetical protein